MAVDVQAFALLLHARQVAGRVHDVDDGDVVRVAGADEARALVGGVRVDAAGQMHRVVGHEADGAAVDAPECADEVLRIPGLDLDEVLVIAEARDPLAEQLVGSLSDRWDGIPARQIRSDHPLRETVARAAASIRSVARADRGPRLWMSRLSTRPTRATRRRFLAGSLALVLAFTTCGTELTGERVVRALGAASVAGVALVLLLPLHGALCFPRLLRLDALAAERLELPRL